MTRVAHLDRSGIGTWSFTGAQPAEKGFISADVEDGFLRLEAATSRLLDGGDLSVADGATLEIDGTGILRGVMVSSGALALGFRDRNGDADGCAADARRIIREMCMVPEKSRCVGGV